MRAVSPRHSLPKFVLYIDPTPEPIVPDLVPAPALREIAKQLRRMAQTYDDEAARRDYQARNARSVTEISQDWPPMIEAHMSAGMSAGQAIRALAQETGADVHQIDAVWLHHCRKAKAARTPKRIQRAAARTVR